MEFPLDRVASYGKGRIKGRCLAVGNMIGCFLSFTLSDGGKRKHDNISIRGIVLSQPV